MTDNLVRHRGGCHCGAVRFEAEAPASADVAECNCSMCSKAGYLHLFVPGEHFRIVAGSELLTRYEFNTKTAKHFFCSVCGIKSFYVPRSHPDGYSINARCLDEGSFTIASVRAIDGREWEKTYPEGRGHYS